MVSRVAWLASLRKPSVLVPEQTDRHRLQPASLRQAPLLCVCFCIYWPLPEPPADPLVPSLPSGQVYQAEWHRSAEYEALGLSLRGPVTQRTLVPLKAGSMPCSPVPHDSSMISISVSEPTQVHWGEGSAKQLQNDNAGTQVKYVPLVSHSALTLRDSVCWYSPGVIC